MTSARVGTANRCDMLKTAYRFVGHLSKIFWTICGIFWSCVNFGYLWLFRWSGHVSRILHNLSIPLLYLIESAPKSKVSMLSCGNQSLNGRYSLCRCVSVLSGCPYGNAECYHPPVSHEVIDCGVCNRENTGVYCNDCNFPCVLCTWCMRPNQSY